MVSATLHKIGGNRGAAGQGRPKGSPNKVTALLKDAILKAAEDVGEDGKGQGGLVGYCTRLARDEPRAFCQLLGRILPLQLAADPEDAITEIVIRRFGDEPSQPRSTI